MDSYCKEFFSRWLFIFSIHKKGVVVMTNRNDNRNQPHTGGSKADTEFGAESGLSKKARKQAARENKKK
jgi:hypothetical protein